MQVAPTILAPRPYYLSEPLTTTTDDDDYYRKTLSTLRMLTYIDVNGDYDYLFSGSWAVQSVLK